MNRLSLSLIVILFFSSIGFGYLSYKFYADKQVVVEQYEQLVKDNKSLEDNLKLLRESYKIGELYVETDTKINDQLSDVESSTLEGIARLTPKNNDISKDVSKPNVKENKNEGIPSQDVADIDDKLPADLSNLLHKSYSDLQRNSSLSGSTK